MLEGFSQKTKKKKRENNNNRKHLNVQGRQKRRLSILSLFVLEDVCGEKQKLKHLIESTGKAVMQIVSFVIVRVGSGLR